MPRTGPVPVAKLRELAREMGYRYKDQGERCMIYMKPGSPVPLNLPRCEMLDVVRTGQILKIIGLGPKDIEDFVADRQ